jgi:hypothetical protein
VVFALAEAIERSQEGEAGCPASRDIRLLPWNGFAVAEPLFSGFSAAASVVFFSKLVEERLL